MARRALFSDRSWIEWNEDIVQDIGYVIMIPVMDTSNAVGVLRIQLALRNHSISPLSRHS